ncbi:hypothetical protein PR002_g25217 [Phytophthora rubi]|uniref:Uncharacterized protein n=1 Tax=Phytophthora rubi TaxID=129364 RepID=A0A6A3I8Y3_9STRA|nr:hypothetical protein PR002_g25217 [Phytophthora rubi]
MGRFVFLALADAAMLPALDVMKRNRRHFELFVGVFHLVIAFCFNATEAFDTQLFLKEDETRTTKSCCPTFEGAALYKANDGWNSTLYEGLLVVCYLLGVAYRSLFTQSSNISPLNKQNATYGIGCLLLPRWWASLPFSSKTTRTTRRWGSPRD